MTSPAATTPGIVAFIEAQCDRREEMARGATASEWFGALGRELLAEVAKDRAILALHRPVAVPSGAVCETCYVDDSNYEDTPAPYPCQTVRLLAAVDADHPDYDASWKPVAT